CKNLPLLCWRRMLCLAISLSFVNKLGIRCRESSRIMSHSYHFTVTLCCCPLSSHRSSSFPLQYCLWHFLNVEKFLASERGRG
ncbi:hypothetical protein PRIPAC_85784, partial [Pristionchus pacificus]